MQKKNSYTEEERQAALKEINRTCRENHRLFEQAKRDLEAVTKRLDKEAKKKKKKDKKG